MKSKILGLLAVGLLAGPMDANAVLLNFSLTDGLNEISFQLDSNPSPSTVTGDGPVFSNISVTTNGTASLWNVFFGLTAAEGGLSLTRVSPCAPNCRLLDQAGPQLFTGMASSPVFATGTFSLSDFSMTSATYENSFRLRISSVPEPGTLALLGLGLTGLALSRRRKAG